MTVERLDLSRDLRMELKKKYSRPDTSTGSAASVFATYSAVKAVLDRERLRRLLSGCHWFSEERFELLFESSLRVIATLITIEWNEWENFYDIFLERRDQSERLLHGDHRLPFLDLGFL